MGVTRPSVMGVTTHSAKAKPISTGRTRSSLDFDKPLALEFLDAADDLSARLLEPARQALERWPGPSDLVLLLARVRKQKRQLARIAPWWPVLAVSGFLKLFPREPTHWSAADGLGLETGDGERLDAIDVSARIKAAALQQRDELFDSC